MATIKVYIVTTEVFDLDFDSETIEGAIEKGQKYCDSWSSGNRRVLKVDTERTESEYLEKLHPHFVAPCTCRRVPSYLDPGTFFIGGSDDCPVHGFGNEENL